MTNEYWEESPWFWNEIRERKEQGGVLLAVATGLPNFGKSYWCMSVMQDFHLQWQLPELEHDGIVFNSGQFWNRMQTCGEWEWTLWDEPNKGLSHRDWYLDMNKAVVTYIQTFRFRHKPLLLALPHIRLLDKSARAVMVGEAMMKRPGLGRVHQLEPDYFGNREFFKYFRGEVEEYLPSRKFREWYEEAKTKFHEEDFPEEAFKEEAKPEVRGWKRIYQLVKANPDTYKIEDPQTKKPRLSARKISALLDCSDNTARKVLTKLEFESRVQPLEGNPKP